MRYGLTITCEWRHLTLGNNAAGLWKGGELFDARHDTAHNPLGLLNRVRADVRLNPDDWCNAC